MSVSYKPLRHTLVDKGLTTSDLRSKYGGGLNSATVTRLNRDEYVSLQTIEQLCKFLSCNVEDVVEFNFE